MNNKRRQSPLESKSQIKIKGGAGLVDKQCPTLCGPHGLQPTRLLCPRYFPGKNTGVGCHFPLEGIFPTQGLNLGLLNSWRRDRLSTPVFLGFSGGSAGKESTCNAGDLGSIPGQIPGKIAWRRERLLTPVFQPGEFHGLQSSWGRNESETTERLSLPLLHCRQILYQLSHQEGKRRKQSSLMCSRTSECQQNPRSFLAPRGRGKTKIKVFAQSLSQEDPLQWHILLQQDR